MGKIKDVFLEIDHMMENGTDEQKKEIQKIIEQHQHDEREMDRELLKFIIEYRKSIN